MTNIPSFVYFDQPNLVTMYDLNKLKNNLIKIYIVIDMWTTQNPCGDHICTLMIGFNHKKMTKMVVCHHHV
jgi:hypothetical protein